MKRAPLEKRESNARSLLKAFSWRIVATLSTITIAWLISGEVDKALTIGGIEFVAKFFIYYGHERIWAIVPHGTFPRVRGH